VKDRRTKRYRLFPALIAEAVVTDGPITSWRKTVVTADTLVKRAPDSRSGKDHLPSEETAELQKAELQE
jgi:hypothetical protein